MRWERREKERGDGPRERKRKRVVGGLFEAKADSSVTEGSLCNRIYRGVSRPPRAHYSPMSHALEAVGWTVLWVRCRLRN